MQKLLIASFITIFITQGILSCGKYCTKCIIQNGNQICQLCTSGQKNVAECSKPSIENCFMQTETNGKQKCQTCRLTFAQSEDNNSCLKMPQSMNGKNLENCILAGYPSALNTDDFRCLACMNKKAINTDTYECTRDGTIANCEFHGVDNKCKFCEKGYYQYQTGDSCEKFRVSEGCSSIGKDGDRDYCRECNYGGFWYAKSAVKEFSSALGLASNYEQVCEYGAWVLKVVFLGVVGFLWL